MPPTPRVSPIVWRSRTASDLEVEEGGGVPADLNHVDDVVAAVDRGAPVADAVSIVRAGAERPARPAGHRCGVERFGVDVVQRDRGVGELRECQQVAEEVLRELDGSRRR